MNTFKYTKICKNPACKKTFKTNREWQNFHKPECYTEYWKNKRKANSSIKQEIKALKKEQKELKREMRELRNARQ